MIQNVVRTEPNRTEPNLIAKSFFATLHEAAEVVGVELVKRVEWKKLEQCVEYYDGTHQTPKYTNSGVPFVSVQNIQNIYKSDKYISKEDFDKYKVKPKVGDIFMTRIGDIGSCAIVKNNDDLAYYVTLTLIRPNKGIINSSFLKYFIESSYGKRELNRLILHNARPIKINLKDIGKVNFPLPPLAVQNYIVEKLDKFDTLVNDISIGLPREIELRKKQYEYFREELLKFDRKG